MEVHRGVCIFCLDHNHRIITASDAQEFIDLIPQILGKTFLNELEFQKVKDSLKICSICCYKFSVVNATKAKIDKSQPENPGNHECYFCSKESHLVRVERDWKYFHDRTEGVYDLTKWKIVFICLECLFYLDAAFSIRNKLFAKHPQVQLERKSKQSAKQIKSPRATPKRASSNSPSSAKKRTFQDCFEHLTPLSAKSYRIDKQHKNDAQLYRQIPYINLKQSSKSPHIPKSDRPKIRIKLMAPKSKKERVVAVKDHNKNNSSKEKLPVESTKLRSKSAEVPLKKKKIRRTSDPTLVPEEDNSDNIDDTPKNTKIAPKRRQSLFVEPPEEEVVDETKEETANATKRRQSLFVEPPDEEVVDDTEEETPNATKRRQSLFVEPPDEEVVDDTEEETPNATKRRQSLFVEPPDEEVEDDTKKETSPLDVSTSEEEPEVVHVAENLEEPSIASENVEADSSTPKETDDNINDIIKKYANDGESEKSGENGVVDLTLNGDDVVEALKNDEKDDVSEEDEVVVLSGNDADNEEEEPNKEVTDLNLDKDASFIYSDLDGKTSEAGSDDRDSVTGSERKKKRVTFSDDI